MLILFDVDGTLVQFNELDTCTWIQAAKDVLGLTDLDTDWGNYQNVTDSGILHEIFCTRIGRPPLPAERNEFIQHLVSLITDSKVHEVPSAVFFLDYLYKQGHRTAIATGCWREVALLK